LETLQHLPRPTIQYFFSKKGVKKMITTLMYSTLILSGFLYLFIASIFSTNRLVNFSIKLFAVILTGVHSILLLHYLGISFNNLDYDFIINKVFISNIAFFAILFATWKKFTYFDILLKMVYLLLAISNAVLLASY
jgi:hypothetical protein